MALKKVANTAVNSKLPLAVGNPRGLRIMPRYGIKNKKNRFGYRSVPLRTTIGDVGTTQGGERVNLFFFMTYEF